MVAPTAEMAPLILDFRDERKGRRVRAKPDFLVLRNEGFLVRIHPVGKIIGLERMLDIIDKSFLERRVFASLIPFRSD